MQLSPEERENIYLEEKKKREGEHSGPSLTLFALTIGAMLGLAGILTIAAGLHEKEISLEDLRKAYPGLSPDDDQES